MCKHLACGVALGLLLSISIGAEQTDELCGQVVDENGKPVTGAKVLAYAAATGEGDDRELAAITTGPDGRFAFPLPGETSVSAIVATKEARCLDWTDSPGRPARDLVFRLGPAATIEGEIVDEAGKPIGGASVDALLLLEEPEQRRMYRPLPGNGLKTKTDDRGRFRFTNIPGAAKVGFDVSAPGRARALTEAPSGPSFVPGQKGLRFVLPLEGRIEGIVVDKATGAPLADLSLRAVGSLTGGMHWAVAKSNKQGHFSFGGLSGGKYSLEIVGTGQDVPEWLGSKEPVQVATGKVSSPVRIEASRAGILELTLTDASTGKPIAASGSVTVSPAQDMRIFESGVTSRNGIALFCLAPGNYVVRERESLLTGYSFKQEEDKSFLVEAGKTRRATLSLAAIVPKVAVVLDPAGKPAPGAKVRVLPLGRDPKDLVTDGSGRFTLDSGDIGPFFCFISVRHPKLNLTALTGVEKDGKPVRIMLQPPAKVSGAVLDPQGRPISGASVQAQIGMSHLGRSSTIATARSDQQGRYDVELAVSSFEYVISAQASGFGLVETVVTPDQLMLGQPQAKDLILKPANRVIRGVVHDAQGNPVAGVIVQPTSAGGLRLPQLSAVTDDEGRFTFEHLTDDPLIYIFAQVPGRGWIGDCGLRPGQTEVVIEVGPSHYD